MLLQNFGKKNASSSLSGRYIQSFMINFFYYRGKKINKNLITKFKTFKIDFMYYICSEYIIIFYLFKKFNLQTFNRKLVKIFFSVGKFGFYRYSMKLILLQRNIVHYRYNLFSRYVLLMILP